MTSHRATGILVAATAIVALAAGCGPDGSDRDGERAPLLLSQLRKADCGDWQAAPARDRRAVVGTLAAYYGRNLPTGSPVQTLPADEAYDLFGKLCSHARAKDLFLWGVYVQAAGFGGYQRAYTTGLRRPDGTPR